MAPQTGLQVYSNGRKVTISGVQELAMVNTPEVKRVVRAALADGEKVVEIDLSATKYVDTSDLGALISFDRETHDRCGMLRLLNPSPTVRWIFEITQTHRIFELVPS